MDKITKALIKKATGFDCTEVVEEFSGNEGEMVLVKRRVTKKYVPPDVAAIKELKAVKQEQDITQLSDEQLEKERLRLLGQL